MENKANPLYKLKWCKFANNLIEVIKFSEAPIKDMGKENLESCKFTDVTLVCGVHYVKAHKLILSASSDFFKHIFEVHSNDDPVVTLGGIDISEMNVLLQFIYQGQVRLLESELPTFLQAAEALQIKGLSQFSRSFKNRDFDSILEVTKKGRRNSVKAISSTTKITEIQGDSTFETTSGVRSLKTIKVEPPEIEEINDDIALNEWEQMDDIQDSNETNNHQCFGNSINKQTIKTEKDSPNSKLPSTHSPVSVHLSTNQQDEEHIPRPPNAFMIFANEWRRKLAQNHPGENNKEISVRLGQMWKGMAIGDKDKYYRASHIADKNHREKYPNYYYSPKEARIRKSLRQRKRTFDPPLVRKIFVESKPNSENELKRKTKVFIEEKAYS